jgi:hypothetical protein
VSQIRVPLRPVEQLADDQQRPAFPYEGERMGHWTVLVEFPHRCSS